ncbi:FixH family protein [Methylosinus sp. H3A]|uniref:FixH family protein n=1 Tax=Methylosinus sp. H3A TaxID=2785786 RepID=UPI0018C3001F|nr:FixH family protein [Methylosinus sp. H3A]MBG0809071.1 FixH family protein [Methylosinus sp. H3A]
MSQTHLMRAAPQRRLGGAEVLALLIFFFGAVAAVNGVMIYAAVTTFRGEEIGRAYEKGLAYNLDIAGAREQSARDWKVEATILGRGAWESLVSVTLRDRSGALTGLKLTAEVRAPVDGRKDVAVVLVEAAPGRYEAPLAIESGWRDLVLIASRDGREMFRSKSRIRID